MDTKIIEDHQIHVMDHVMRVEDNVLTEKRIKTKIEGKYSEYGVSTVIRERIRSIEAEGGQNRNLKITEVVNGTGHRTVETDMTKDEIKQFENDWDKLASIAFLQIHPNVSSSEQIQFD